MSETNLKKIPPVFGGIFSFTVTNFNAIKIIITVTIIGLSHMKNFFSTIKNAFLQKKQNSNEQSQFDFAIDKPDFLKNFEINLLNTGKNPLEKEYEIRCKHCNHNKFQIYCYNSSNDDDIEELNPHHLGCEKCGKKELLFDLRIHGYDGILGHPPSYQIGEGIDNPIECDKSFYNVSVSLLYNTPIEELLEISSGENCNYQDLFDFISINAKNDDGELLKELTYECA